MRLLKSPYRLPDIGDICFVTDADRNNWYLDYTRKEFAIDAPIRLCLNAVGAGEEFIDLGANIGHFALPLGKKGARVLAVEAIPRTARLLNLAICESRIENATVVQAAVTDRVGIAHMIGEGPWAQLTGAGKGPEVPATTLPRVAEEHGFSRPRMIKIDIEGAELDVLSPAADWLRAQPQCELLVEFNAWTWHALGRSIEDGLALLSAAGYRLFMLQRDRLIPKRPGEYLEQCVADIFATRAPGAAAINGFAIVQLDAEESLALLQTDMTRSAHHRFHAATVLADHWPKLRSFARASEMIEQLLADPEPAVPYAVARLRGLA